MGFLNVISSGFFWFMLIYIIYEPALRKKDIKFAVLLMTTLAIVAVLTSGSSVTKGIFDLLLFPLRLLGASQYLEY